MVKPSQKRQVVVHLKTSFKAGLARCCSLVNWSRSNWYYESKKDDSELQEKLEGLTLKYPTRGFDNYYNRLRNEGYKWSRNRVLRVYRELGLVRRKKKRKKLPEALRKPIEQPRKLNEIWSMDFMSDSLQDGRALRVLNIIDDCNRESLCITGTLSFPAERLVRVLDELVELHGYPKYIRTDNGPEFISKHYQDWCKRMNITPVYIEPGKPMQNGYIERFNRTFREDVLDAYMFSSYTDFNRLGQDWRMDYNAPPHKGLGYKTPKQYALRA